MENLVLKGTPSEPTFAQFLASLDRILDSQKIAETDLDSLQETIKRQVCIMASVHKVAPLSIIQIIAELAHVDELRSKHAWLLLVVCVRSIYQSLGLSNRYLQQVESKCSREHQPIQALARHLLNIYAVMSRPPRGYEDIRLLQERGIFFFESYDPQELFDILEAPIDPSGPCDLCLRFPAVPYTSESAEYCAAKDEEREKKPLLDDERIFTRPGGNRIVRSDSSIPLFTVEGRDIPGIKSSLAQFKARVRYLIIGGHGCSDGVTVDDCLPRPVVIRRETLRNQWTTAIWACLNPNEPQACIILLSCETGVQGGIGEAIHRATGTPVVAPIDVVNGVSIECRPETDPNFQFWNRDLPVGTRVIALPTRNR